MERKKKNHEKADEYYTKYNSCFKRINKENNNKPNIQLIEAKYNVNLLQSENNILKTKIKWILIGTFLLVIIIGISSKYLYLAKKKILELKNDYSSLQYRRRADFIENQGNGSIRELRVNMNRRYKQIADILFSLLVMIVLLPCCCADNVTSYRQTDKQVSVADICGDVLLLFADISCREKQTVVRFMWFGVCCYGFD